jgi:hypothetical protein
MEGDNRRAGIDDQLPGIGKKKNRSQSGPNHDHQAGSGECPLRSQPAGSIRCESSELIGRGSYLNLNRMFIHTCLLKTYERSRCDAMISGNVTGYILARSDRLVATYLYRKHKAPD